MTTTILMIRLAWRNLWRTPRRTILMLAAAATGAWFMIAFAAIARGAMEKMIDQEFKTLPGHGQVHAFGWRDDPVVGRRIPAPGTSMIAALNPPIIKGWSARVRVPAVISSERDSVGVTLVGIDPRREQGISFIGDGVSAGENLTGPDDARVLLGAKLASQLETGIGRRVVVMSQDANDRIADRGFRVAGIFHAEPEAVETEFVFTGRAAAQHLIKIDRDVSEIAFIVTDRQNLAEAVEGIRKADQAVEVLSWQQINPLIVMMQRLTDTMLWIWYFIVFAAMSFGLVNTMLMAVHERTREFGLFQALGMPPGQLLGQIFFESLFLISLALAAGDFFSWLTLYSLRGGIDLSAFSSALERVGMSPVILPVTSARDVLRANVLIGILGMAACVYPAWRAGRRVPVEVIARA